MLIYFYVLLRKYTCYILLNQIIEGAHFTQTSVYKIFYLSFREQRAISQILPLGILIYTAKHFIPAWFK